MNQTQFSDGEVILSEGEASDSVYRILLGEVEIYTEQHGETIVLGTAKTGEFLGEMGIIERRPRSASARAIGEVMIEKLERWEFVQLISDSPVSANRLIERLSERLRQANRRLAQMVADARPESETTAADAASASAPVTLFADSDRLSDSLPPSGIPVTEFPFTVGRQPRADEPDPGMPVQLSIPDSIPFRLSFTHFSVVREDGGFAVRDLGSAHGTSVNGVFIGDHFERDTCTLENGSNTVIAGGVNSPYRFEVVVAGL